MTSWTQGFEGGKVALVSSDKKTKPISIDFVKGKTAWRTQRVSKKELIAKAVWVTPKFKPRVLDATAGFGRDAFILSNLGCEVLMVERSPVLASMLKDALNRLYQAQDKIK